MTIKTYDNTTVGAVEPDIPIPVQMVTTDEEVVAVASAIAVPINVDEESPLTGGNTNNVSGVSSVTTPATSSQTFQQKYSDEGDTGK